MHYWLNGSIWLRLRRLLLQDDLPTEILPLLGCFSHRCCRRAAARALWRITLAAHRRLALEDRQTLGIKVPVALLIGINSSCLCASFPVINYRRLAKTEDTTL